MRKQVNRRRRQNVEVLLCVALFSCIHLYVFQVSDRGHARAGCANGLQVCGRCHIHPLVAAACCSHSHAHAPHHCGDAVDDADAAACDVGCDPHGPSARLASSCLALWGWRQRSASRRTPSRQRLGRPPRRPPCDAPLAAHEQVLLQQQLQLAAQSVMTRLSSPSALTPASGRPIARSQRAVTRAATAEREGRCGGVMPAHGLWSHEQQPGARM